MGNGGDLDSLMFQHTAARRRLDETDRNRCRLCSFNTQPPEGGWSHLRRKQTVYSSFNTQPPEGGWLKRASSPTSHSTFQHTAARRRLEKDCKYPLIGFRVQVSTHSRPKAAGFLPLPNCLQVEVSTHSRPKAAGPCFFWCAFFVACFNTQPPEGGWAEAKRGD